MTSQVENLKTPSEELAEDSEKLLRSALALNLQMTPEERIGAHENALQLAMDLKEAGKALRAAES